MADSAVSRYAKARYGVFNYGGQLVVAPVPGSDASTPAVAPQSPPEAPQRVEKAPEPDMRPEAVRERRAARRRERGRAAEQYINRAIAAGDAIDFGDQDGSGLYMRYGDTPRAELHRRQAFQASMQSEDPYGPRVPLDPNPLGREGRQYERHEPSIEDRRRRWLEAVINDYLGKQAQEVGSR